MNFLDKKLFNERLLRNMTDQILTLVKDKITNLSDEELDSMTPEAVFDSYVKSNNYYLDKIELLEDDIQKDIQYYNDSRNILNGYENSFKLVYKIPFKGDPSLFFIKPRISVSFDKKFDLFPEDNVLQFYVCVTSQQLADSCDIEKYTDIEKEKTLKTLRFLVCNLNKEVDEFNKGLLNFINAVYYDRKKILDNKKKLIDILNIPLKLSVNTSNSEKIKLKLRTHITKNVSKEYYISDDDYLNIKNIINLVGMAMEETAKTYSKLEEEEIRDIIVATLNTHYEQVSGETFRREGKTDILILFREKAAFIAECKIWRGVAHFKSAIKQLFSYATWKDKKLALIVFNKDVKDFKKIQEEINFFLLSIKAPFKRIDANVWETSIRDDDSNLKFDVAIMLYNFYIPSHKN